MDIFSNEAMEHDIPNLIRMYLPIEVIPLRRSICVENVVNLIPVCRYRKMTTVLRLFATSAFLL